MCVGGKVMFYSDQNKSSKKKYQKMLKIIGCLSNLFTDSEIPYLYYRIAEKVFCQAFSAEDLSRSDVSADAQKNNLGIGLKTFRAGNNKTFQKVAEFNRDLPSYSNLSAMKLVKQISKLRNERLSFTSNAHKLNDLMYHCVLREANCFKIFEEPMLSIDVNNIKIIDEKRTSIFFTDEINEYSFSLSKSTLSKRFVTNKSILEFGVEILKDPLTELQSLLSKDLIYEDEKEMCETIYLPLYSSRTNKVQKKSGLNQWNASGRRRHLDEAYIPIPCLIHKNFPNFFPSRDTAFVLKLPSSSESLSAKVCQDGGKALMSCPNRELGKWILREVLKIKAGELLTYEKLEELDIDSVRIDKFRDNTYQINFAKIGTYKNFEENFIGSNE